MATEENARSGPLIITCFQSRSVELVLSENLFGVWIPYCARVRMPLGKMPTIDPVGSQFFY